MPEKGEYQIVGDRSDLGQKPLGTPAAVKTAGQYQLTGDGISEMKMMPPGIPSPSAIKGSGEYQFSGERTPNPSSPVKEIGNSSTLPFSDRAVAQSNVGPIPTGKK